MKNFYDSDFERHSTNPYYRMWYSMMYRCYNAKCPAYKNYGGRGIIVCDQWHDFDTFVVDISTTLGPRPEGLTFERADNEGNYERGNVEYASYADQLKNRRPIQAVTRTTTSSKASRYKGVCHTKEHKSWRAVGYHGGRTYFLGNHAIEEDAARAHDKWAMETFGPEYKGPLNFPGEIDE